MVQCVCMEKDLISVIIPCHNCEKTLFRAVNSILEQDHRALELILVDDGSEDDTLQLARKFAAADSRVQVLALKHGGVSVARNNGLKHAKGEYVAFVDADDNYTTPRTLSTMLRQLKETGADRCVCNFTHPCFEQHLTGGVYDLTQPDQFMTYYKDFFACSMPWNKLTRRECLTEPFVLGLGLGEDEIFNLANLKNIQKVVVHDEVLYNYYCTPYIPSSNASAITKTVSDSSSNFTVWHMFMKNHPLREAIVQRDFPARATTMANIRAFDFFYWIFWLMAKNRTTVNGMAKNYTSPVINDPLFQKAMQDQPGLKPNAWDQANIEKFSKIAYYAFADIHIYHRDLLMYHVFSGIMAKIFLNPKAKVADDTLLGHMHNALQANTMPEAIYVNNLFDNALLPTEKEQTAALDDVLDLWLQGTGSNQ